MLGFRSRFDGTIKEGKAEPCVRNAVAMSSFTSIMNMGTIMFIPILTATDSIITTMTQGTAR